MSFRDKVADLLTNHKMILPGYQPSDLELLERIDDLIMDNHDLAKEQARLECLRDTVRENTKVELLEEANGDISVLTFRVRPFSYKYTATSLTEALDKMHKGEHESR